MTIWYGIGCASGDDRLPIARSSEEDSTLRDAGVHVRNDIVEGVGGRQVLVLTGHSMTWQELPEPDWRFGRWLRRVGRRLHLWGE
jgi:hypothetical protein